MIFRTSLIALIMGVNVISPYTFAAEYKRSDVVVNSLFPMAGQRPNKPSSQDFIRLYVESGAWETSACRPTAVDISKSDSHILSTLLSALAQGHSIKIGVDDTLKPIDDTCQVTYIQVFVN